MGQTGMLRIFTLAGAQVCSLNLNKCSMHSVLHAHKGSVCLADLLLQGCDPS